ncbi:MAG: S-layer homology domain-containing protein [Oscillospiraceae bacterium]|jgi:hypothetical protein|nr:S-layer homology domain-containing protein [Oscillospiraceae bacterium]
MLHKGLSRRFLAFALALVLALALVPATPASAAGGEALNYEIAFANGTTPPYKLNITSFETDNNVHYGSINITYPATLTLSFASATPSTGIWYQLLTNGATTNSYSLTAKADSGVAANDVKAILEGARFDLTTAGVYPSFPDNNIIVELSVPSAGVAKWVDPTGVIHYYEIVKDENTSTTERNWFDHYNLARKRKYKGLPGYLTTITSADEQKYIYSAISSLQGTIGGTRIRFLTNDPKDPNGTYGTYIDGSRAPLALAKKPSAAQNDHPQEGDLKKAGYTMAVDANGDGVAAEWYWADGPESASGPLGGTGTPVIFKTRAKGNDPAYIPAGAFSAFDGGEPNNNESCETVIYIIGGSMVWNDYPNAHIGLEHYYVEYSSNWTGDGTYITNGPLEWSDSVPSPTPVNITFKANLPGGSSAADVYTGSFPESKAYVPGTQFSLPSITAKAGYLLSSWNVSFPYTVTTAATIEATFLRNDVTVTFKKNGADWTDFKGVVTLDGKASDTVPGTGSQTRTFRAVANKNAYTVIVDGVSTGVSVIVSNNSPTATVNYYTVTTSATFDPSTMSAAEKAAAHGNSPAFGTTTHLPNTQLSLANLAPAANSGYRLTYTTTGFIQPDFTVGTTAATLAATYTRNDVTVNFRKNGNNWTNFEGAVKLSSGDDGIATVGASRLFTAVTNSTYHVWVNGVDTGVSVTVADNSPTVTLDYQTVNVNDGNPAGSTSAVSITGAFLNANGSTNLATDTSAVALSNASITANATLTLPTSVTSGNTTTVTNYVFKDWTTNNGGSFASAASNSSVFTLPSPPPTAEIYLTPNVVVSTLEVTVPTPPETPKDPTDKPETIEVEGDTVYWFREALNTAHTYADNAAFTTAYGLVTKTENYGTGTTSVNVPVDQNGRYWFMAAHTEGTGGASVTSYSISYYDVNYLYRPFEFSVRHRDTDDSVNFAEYAPIANIGVPYDLDGYSETPNKVSVLMYPKFSHANVPISRQGAPYSTYYLWEFPDGVAVPNTSTTIVLDSAFFNGLGTGYIYDADIHHYTVVYERNPNMWKKVQAQIVDSAKGANIYIPVKDAKTLPQLITFYVPLDTALGNTSTNFKTNNGKLLPPTDTVQSPALTPMYTLRGWYIAEESHKVVDFSTEIPATFYKQDNFTEFDATFTLGTTPDTNDIYPLADGKVLYVVYSDDDDGDGWDNTKDPEPTTQEVRKLVYDKNARTVLPETVPDPVYLPNSTSGYTYYKVPLAEPENNGEPMEYMGREFLGWSLTHDGSSGLLQPGDEYLVDRIPGKTYGYTVATVDDPKIDPGCSVHTLYAIWYGAPAVRLSSPNIDKVSGNVTLAGQVVRVSLDYTAKLEYRAAGSANWLTIKEFDDKIEELATADDVGGYVIDSYAFGVDEYGEHGFVIPANKVVERQYYEVRLTATDRIGGTAVTYSGFYIDDPDKTEIEGDIINDTGEKVILTITLEAGNTVVSPPVIVPVDPYDDKHPDETTGHFKFGNVPDGVFNLVADNGLYKVTLGVWIVDHKLLGDPIVMHITKTESTVSVTDEESPKISVAGLPDLYEDSLYNKNDQELTKDGGLVEFRAISEYVSKDVKAEENPAFAAAVSAITDTAKDDHKITKYFVNLAVEKQWRDEHYALTSGVAVDLDGITPLPGSDSDGVDDGLYLVPDLGSDYLTIAFNTPSEIGYSEIVAAYRYHDDSVDTLYQAEDLAEAMKSGTNYEWWFRQIDREHGLDYVVFHVRRFSVYALAIERYDVDFPGDGNDNDSSDTDANGGGDGNDGDPREHIAYIRGYEDGTVHPDGDITRAEVAMIFWRLSPDENKELPVASAFPDVEDGAWYAQAVNYLASRGILNGYEDGSFRPDAKITRAEFVAIIERVDGNQLTGELNSLTDVPANHWAISYIISVAQKGWVIGYEDGTFRADSDITRAEAIKIVNAFLDRRAFELNLADTYAELYNDLTPAHWAFNDVIEASVEHVYIFSDSHEVWVA